MKLYWKGEEVKDVEAFCKKHKCQIVEVYQETHYPSSSRGWKETSVHQCKYKVPAIMFDIQRIEQTPFKRIKIEEIRRYDPQ